MGKEKDHTSLGVEKREYKVTRCMEQPPERDGMLSTFSGNLLELFNNFVQEPGLKQQLLRLGNKELSTPFLHLLICTSKCLCFILKHFHRQVYIDLCAIGKHLPI